MKTIIIGAGLSGLSLAQALNRAGASVTVFERDASPDSRGQGYRLTIDATGSDALEACLPNANYEFIRSTAGASNEEGAFIFLDAAGHELHRFVFDLADAERGGRISGQVDRRTLRNALIAGIAPHIAWGKDLSRYEESPDGVRVHFEDGSSETGDLLIGADGSNSRVRTQRFPDLVPADKGQRAIFGRTPLANRRLRIVDGLLSQGGAMSLGPGGRVFFCTAMRFREQPAAAARRLGLDINAPHRDDYVMWALALPKDVLGGADESAAQDRLYQIARNEARVFEDQFRALVECAEPEEAILVPLRALIAPKAPGSRRVTLMGDAIHVMPPFGAHGANTALKDAHVLAKHLSGNTGASQDVAERIGAYEAEMRSYSADSVREAERMMSMATASFPFKNTVFRALLKLGSAVQNRRDARSRKAGANRFATAHHRST